MSKQGVLLVQTGSPSSPDVADVRRYLREFLMDPRVIDLPWPLRKLLVEGVILPFRTRRSAAAYRKIWTPEGSPLAAHSRRLRDLLRARLEIPVALGMRYGEPSIAVAVDDLRQQGVSDLLVLPLFPHAAAASYGTAAACAARAASDLRVRTVEPFFDHPAYIRALVETAALETGEHLLFSFHGLPERHLRRSSPRYREQCFATVRAFVQAAGMGEGTYSVAFQSRLGAGAWMKPYTHHELARLPRAGIKNLRVICPGFTADCLETLKEIGVRGRETFLNAGGETFRVVPCLNTQPLWVDALEEMVLRSL